MTTPAPGYPCAVCGATPAFLFTGVPLCAEHIVVRKEGS